MLIFDTEQFNETGVYTLYSPDEREAYHFESALEAKEFCDAYHTNKVCALYGYEALAEARKIAAFEANNRTLLFNP